MARADGFTTQGYLTSADATRYHYAMHNAFARTDVTRSPAAADARAITTTRTTTTGTRWRMRLGVVD